MSPPSRHQLLFSSLTPSIFLKFKNVWRSCEGWEHKKARIYFYTGAKSEVLSWDAQTGLRPTFMTAASKAQDSWRLTEHWSQHIHSMWYLQMFCNLHFPAPLRRPWMSVTLTPTRLAISILEACKDKVHTGTCRHEEFISTYTLFCHLNQEEDKLPQISKTKMKTYMNASWEQAIEQTDNSPP